ncbi:MAG: hypothetical protein WDW21_06220 [Neisseriaceae bacterium]
MSRLSSANIFELSWEVEVSEQVAQTALLATPTTSGALDCISKNDCASYGQDCAKVMRPR